MNIYVYAFYTFRHKLEEIAKIGKDSWFRNFNFQKYNDDWDNLHDLSDDLIEDNGNDEDSDITNGEYDDEEDNLTWTGKILKLSRSPTFGSFFGSWNFWTYECRTSESKV